MPGNAQYLLDTNVLLKALLAPEVLPADVQSLLSDPANEVFFSSASLWEIAIKYSLGREDFNFRSEDIQQLALETGFTELPVSGLSCHGVANLPWHHRDPFDRLLIAQAQVIPAYLLTTDAVLGRYSDLVKVVGIN